MKNILLPVFTALALSAVPAQSATFTNLTVTGSTDAGAYSIETNLADGVLSYGDRSEEYINITDNASYLLGADYIRTANDDRSAPGVELSFTLDTASTVYVSQDDRQSSSHSFLGTFGFTDTGDNIGNFSNFSFVEFSVFSADLAAGTYTFNNNAAESNLSMYTLMAQPIPEPSAALLLGGLGMLVLLRRRR